MAERVLVTVAAEVPIADVVAGLEAAGVRVETVLSAVGVIIGCCVDDGPSALAALAGIPGVAAVERDRAVRLPPPGSDVQ